MCGRFTLTDPARLDTAALGIALLPSLGPRFNIAPTQDVLLVHLDRDGRRRATLARWGLIPSWAKDASIGNRMANARGETLAEKPSFRSAWRRRRGLVFADGFYEWQALPDRRVKQPWWITRADHAPFAFGALWEVWQPPEPDAEPICSCTLVTTAPNALMAPIHDRMPVIVAPDDWARWLGDGLTDAPPPADLVAPCDPAGWTVRAVSTWVNTPAHDDAQCIAPAASLP
jgi:putative SOS response-associated peptidase YedK